MGKHYRSKKKYVKHVRCCQQCQTGKQCQKGEGLYDDVKKGYENVKLAFQGPRQSVPPVAREFLQKYGQGNIVELFVCRKPIIQAIEQTLNILSLGQFEKDKQKLGYDKLYHLFFMMKIALQNDQGQSILSSIRLEKNQVVEIYHSEDMGTDFKQVHLKKQINASDFIAHGEKYQGKSFWLYSATDNNCQIFAQSCLKGNHLYSPELKSFVLQPVAKLIDGFLKKIGQTTTDIAGSVDRALHGDGFRKRRKNK